MDNSALDWPIERCYQEGVEAGKRGLDFDACPFQFWKAGTDQQTFDAIWRPRLNAWFSGWKTPKDRIDEVLEQMAAPVCTVRVPSHWMRPIKKAL